LTRKYFGINRLKALNWLSFKLRINKKAHDGHDEMGHYVEWERSDDEKQKKKGKRGGR